MSQGSDRDGAKSPSDKDSESSDWDSWDEDNNEVFSEQPANIQCISEDVWFLCPGFKLNWMNIPYTCTGIVHIFPFLGGIPLFENKKIYFSHSWFFWFSSFIVSLILNDIELQEQSALTQAFGEFLKCLKKICDSSKFDSRPNNDIPDTLPWYL